MKYIFVLGCLLTVCNAQDFTISVTPQTQSIVSGSTATYQIHITPNNGYNASVYLNVESQLVTSSVKLTRSLVNYPYTDTQLDVQPSPNETGTIILKVKGKNSGIEASALCTLNVKKNDQWSAVKGAISSFNTTMYKDKNQDITTIKYYYSTLYISHFVHQTWESEILDLKDVNKSLEFPSLNYDSTGSLWYTTLSSIVKYDGKYFTEFNPPTFNTNITHCVSADRIGGVFLQNKNRYNLTGGYFNTIYHFNNHMWDSIQIYDVNLGSKLVGVRGYFVNDTSNVLWVPSNYGTFRVSDSTVAHLHRDNSGIKGENVLLIGVNYGTNVKYFLSKDSNKVIVNSYDDNTWKKLNYTLPAYLNYNQILVDKSDNIWIVSDSGMYRLEGGNTTLYNQSNSPLPSMPIRKILLDGNENLWIDFEPRSFSGSWDKFFVFNPNGIVGVPIITTDVEDNKEAQQEVQVYPNPSNEQVTIQTGVSDIPITIVDVLGREVYKRQVTEPSVTLSTQQFPDGVYYVRVGEKVASIVVRH